MAVLLSLLLFLGGLYLIIKGGDFLVDSALLLNKVTGINQVIIGATFVSVATTLPEVFVSFFAVMASHHGIAVGNAIGSMICNIALVFALYISFIPHKVKRAEILHKSFFLIVITLVVLLFASNFRISLIEGAVLMLGFFAFLLFNLHESKQLEDEIVPNGNLIAQDKATKKQAYKNVLLSFLVGQFMLIVGAFIIVEHGERLSFMFGISETVVGLSVIAIGTSMPELITCISSIKKKSSGLALGNVIGANIINCTLLIGTCGLISGIKRAPLPLSTDTLYISLPFLLITTCIAIAPMLFRERTYRAQGIVLLACYVCYLVYLVLTQPI